MDLPDASDSRLAQLTRWVFDDLGFEGGRLAPASADASFRRYFRVTRGEDTYIVMDAPPDKEDLGPFSSVARLLLRIGVNVPAILATDSKRGFLLLSDLGVRQYLDELAVETADRLYADAVAAGYEGVMAKSLASAYTPGARGRGWLKIKHTRTLDLVIVAAEWGYGRRHGWLSNYHLAARDRGGGFAMLGKTFKGLNDEQFRAMTERLIALKTAELHGVVTVRPEVVVEVAYNDIQRSPNYDAGMALRFARIVRIRDDKSPEQADSIDTVNADYEQQKILPSSRKI